MPPRDGFKILDALELALERTLVIERAPKHDLRRTKRAGHAPRQPHVTIAASPDTMQQFVVRYVRSLDLRLVYGHSKTATLMAMTFRASLIASSIIRDAANAWISGSEMC